MKLTTAFLLYFLVFLHLVGLSQNATVNLMPGTVSNLGTNSVSSSVSSKGKGNIVMNGDEDINTSYTTTACGLNYTSFSFNLNQRDFTSGPGLGVVQPAAFVISGIPLCGKILKAFLYTSCESAGNTSITASITNPLFVNQFFPMSLIGTGASKCWSHVSSMAFRADITSIITGNGTYFLSGLPTGSLSTDDDVNGASLFIIYTDESQNYTGSIVVADGMFTGLGAPVTSTITGFNVCGPTSLTTNFMIVDDLQQSGDALLQLNSAVFNYTVPQAGQVPWMLFSQPGNPAFSGQTSATYAVDPGSDCVGIVMAGMYYRTACLTCPTAMTITAQTSTCAATGSATASVLGGLAPLSYTWSGSAASTSVATGLSAGIHTVTVRYPNNCKVPKTTTVNIIGPLSFTPSTSNCAPTGSASATATGGVGPYTYTWSGSPQTNSFATSLAPGTHTVRVRDLNNCQSLTRTISVIGALSFTTATSNCVPTGSASATTTGGVGPYTYTWSGSAQTTSLATGLLAGTRTVTVSDFSNCQTQSQTISITVPTTLAVTNTVLCIGYTTTMTALGPVNSYTWTGPSIIGSVSNSLISANPLTTSIYTVANTNSLNCTSSTTAQIFVVSTQTVPIISPTTCLGKNLILVSNSTYTGSINNWTGPNGFSSTGVIANPTLSPATFAMNGSYSVTVISAPGCTSSAVTSASVFANPTPFINSNTPICEGRTLTLNGGGAVTYTWNGPSSYSAVAQNTTIVGATNALHSGIYTLTAAFANGCSSVVQRSLTVRPLPATTFTTSSPICVNSVLSFTGAGGAPYTWRGPNAFFSLAQNPSINNVQLASSGVYTLVSTLNTCTAIAVQTIVVNPLPVPTATNNSPICANNLLQFTGLGGVTYTWTGPASYSSVVQNDAIASSSLANIGIYTLTVTDVNNCKASTTTTVSILPNPAIAVTGTNVCYGAPGTLSVSGGIGWSWTGPPPNNVTDINQNLIIPIVDNNSSGQYSVVIDAANGCTTTAVATLSTIPLPVILATSTVACFNAITTLTATGAASYTWSGPFGYNYIGQNPVIVANNNAAGTYTILGRGVNTCTDVGVATLTTMPLPTVTAFGTIVCLKTAATLSATGSSDVSNYSWTGPGGYTAGGNLANISTALNVAPVVYTVTVRAFNTCTSLAIATLSTNPLPPVTATGTLICKNEPFKIIANGALSYVWTRPPPLTNSTGSFIVLSSVTASNVGSYTVIGTDINTCTNVATINIDTLSLPNVVAVGNTVCIGLPAVLSASGAVSYAWTGPLGYTSTLANALIPITSNQFTQTYTVVGTAPNTCTLSKIVLLDTHPLPQPSFIAPARVCFGSPIELKGFGAKTYTWTGPFGYYFPQKNVTIPTFNKAQEGIYKLTVHDSLGCKNFTTTFVKIDPLPGGFLSNNNNNNNCAPFCAEYKLNSTSTAIINSSWVANNKIFIGETFTLCVPKPSQNTVIGTFTDVIGCVNTMSFAVQANPSPVADFSYLPKKPIESADLVLLDNASTGEKLVKWNWYFINNNNYISSAKNASYLFDNSGSYPVAMIVTNAWGCSDTVVKVIEIGADYKIFVPNSFTPNGDGVNDTFQPKGRGITKYSLTIYDRWGNRIFNTNDFETGWNGSVYGKETSDDVFVWRMYIVDANAKIHELTGHVNLVR